MHRIVPKRMLIRQFAIVAIIIVTIMASIMIYGNAFKSGQKRHGLADNKDDGIDLDPRLAAHARVLQRQFARNPSKEYLANKKMYDEILEFAGNGGKFSKNKD